MKSRFRKSLLQLIAGIIVFGYCLYQLITNDFQADSNWRILFGFLVVLLGFFGVVVGIKRVLQNKNI
jgi:hypothetical protein